MRMEEMIANLRNFDCYTNSPCQYHRKRIVNRTENKDILVFGFKRLNDGLLVLKKPFLSDNAII